MKNITTAFAFLLIFSLPGFSGIEPINTVLGDKSYLWKYGESPDENTPDQKRISPHFEYVELLLRSKDTKDLSQELKSNRDHLINLLHAYKLAGKFPKNYDRAERRPCFIDKDGTICAVGYLVEQTAGHETAEKINKKFQYARIAEMQTAELDTWIENSGLTKEECKMIQPEYGPTNVSPDYKNGGMEGFRTYLACAIELDSKKVDSVSVSFDVDTVGKAKNIKVKGKDALSAQVKLAIEHATFIPGYQTNWIKPHNLGGTKQESPVKFNLVFNLPADSIYFQKLIDYEKVKKADTSQKEVRITLNAKKNYNYPMYGTIKVFSKTGDLVYESVNDNGISNQGITQFNILKEKLKGNSFDVELNFQYFRKVLVKNVAFNDQDLNIPIEFAYINVYEERGGVNYLGGRIPIRPGVK